MNAVPSGANSVQVTYTRSWNGVQAEPGVAVVTEAAQALELLSTAMNCLSSRGRNERWNPVSKTDRPGKFQEAPPFRVAR